MQTWTISEILKVFSVDFKSDLRSWGLAFREKHFRDHDVSRWESLQKNYIMGIAHIAKAKTFMEPVFCHFA